MQFRLQEMSEPSGEYLRYGGKPCRLQFRWNPLAFIKDRAWVFPEPTTEGSDWQDIPFKTLPGMTVEQLRSMTS